MATRTYDPGKIHVSFGTIPIMSFAEGTFLTVERMSETFVSVAGAGGEVARVRQRDRRGSIKLTLLASSPENDLLSAVQQMDENFGTGQGRFHVTDSNGTTVLHAGNAWIKKPPNVEFAKEMSHREWEFECELIEMNAGGNF